VFYRLGTFCLVVLVVMASVLASAKFWIASEMDRPIDVPEQGFIITVESGSSLSKLSRELAAGGLIPSPVPLLVHSRLHGQPTIIRGDYLIGAGETPRTLLARLVAGDIMRFTLTFPEGLTLAEWLKHINGSEHFEASPLTMEALRREIEVPEGESLEGWFFPDTYNFTREENSLSIMKQAHQRMVELLAQEWVLRQPGLPLETPYEALILASIVEKETGVAAERAEIAGVFVRRLQQGMKLQTDPTVIYGLGEAFDGNLTRAHLQQANPFNTYYIHGLPPSPIANPGRDAIRAVLNPAQGDALYFVARGDGSHQFSATLAEHSKAVRKFQLNRAQHYRSSPK
jgi:peptidoglycan lytic transglycosylase G